MSARDADFAGTLSRKKMDHGRFEDPYKNKVTAWLKDHNFSMQPTNGDVSQKETLNLMHWKVDTVEDTKFCLVHANGQSVKLRADSASDAALWASKLTTAAKKAVKDDEDKRRKHLQAERDRAAAELKAKQEREREEKEAFRREHPDLETPKGGSGRNMDLLRDRNRRSVDSTSTKGRDVTPEGNKSRDEEKSEGAKSARSMEDEKKEGDKDAKNPPTEKKEAEKSDHAKSPQAKTASADVVPTPMESGKGKKEAGDSQKKETESTSQKGVEADKKVKEDQDIAGKLAREQEQVAQEALKQAVAAREAAVLSKASSPPKEKEISSQISSPEKDKITTEKAGSSPEKVNTAAGNSNKDKAEQDPTKAPAAPTDAPGHARDSIGASDAGVGMTPRDAGSDAAAMWEKKFTHAQKMTAKLTAENTALSEMLAGVRKVLEESVGVEGAGGDVKDMAKTLAGRLDEVRKEKERAETAINLAVEQAVSMEKDKDHMQVELELAQEELATIQEELAREQLARQAAEDALGESMTGKDTSSLEERIRELTQELETAHDEHAGTIKMLEEAHAQIDGCKQREDVAQEDLDHTKRLLEQAEAQVRAYKDREGEVERLKKELAEAKAAHSNREVDAKGSDVVELGKAQEAALAELADVKKQRDAAVADVEALTREKDAALADLSAATKDKERIMADLKAAEKDRDAALAGMTKQGGAYEGGNEAEGTHVGETARLQSECDKAHRECEVLQQKLQGRDAQVADLTSKVEGLERDKTKLEQRVRELEKEVANGVKERDGLSVEAMGRRQAVEESNELKAMLRAAEAEKQVLTARKLELEASLLALRESSSHTPPSKQADIRATRDPTSHYTPQRTDYNNSKHNGSDATHVNGISSKGVTDSPLRNAQRNGVPLSPAAHLFMSGALGGTPGKVAKILLASSERHRLATSDYLASLLDSTSEINRVGKGLLPSDMEEIAVFVEAHSNITRLFLSGNSLGSAGAKQVARLLLNQSLSISRLDLRHNGLGVEGSEIIIDAMKSNSSVSRLDLSANTITSACAQSLAELLRKSKTLTRLDLRHNELGDVGAAVIAEALSDATCAVQHLDLSANSVGHKGAESLANALAVNKTLVVLDLRGNAISQAGVRALQDVCSKSTVEDRQVLLPVTGRS